MIIGTYKNEKMFDKWLLLLPEDDNYEKIGDSSCPYCGKSEIEIQKEKIRQQADELRIKIDSTQNAIDSARAGLDSLMYKIRKDSSEIDSMMKKINPLK